MVVVCIKCWPGGASMELSGRALKALGLVPKVTVGWNANLGNVITVHGT